MSREGKRDGAKRNLLRPVIRLDNAREQDAEDFSPSPSFSPFVRIRNDNCLFIYQTCHFDERTGKVCRGEEKSFTLLIKSSPNPYL